MPGGTPQAAVTAFLEPLRQAVSALSGHCQIAAVRKGAYTKGRVYLWHLNGGNGISWPGIGVFTASMGFEIIDADPERHEVAAGDVRVTTRSYHYHFLGPDGVTARWRMHWHPDGQSGVKEPHLHRLPEIKTHWATPRMSFETAIRWCATEGAPLSCSESDAEDRLTRSEAAFKLFGSWQDTPTIRYGRPVSM